MTEVESSFSVATGNKYGFLLDDVEDPEEAIRLAALQKEPKQKKKPKEPKAPVVSKPEETRAPKGEGSDGRRGRRNPDGRNAIPRFSNDREGETGEQRPATRGFGGRGGFGERGGRGGFGRKTDDSVEAGEESGRGRGRGRGGFEGRGRGEGRGGFEGRGRGEGRGGFEGRGRGEGRGGFGRGGEGRGRGRGFNQRGGFGQRSDADGQTGEGEDQPPAPSGGFGRGRGGFNRGGFGNRVESSAEGLEPAGEEDGVEGGEDRPRGRGRGGFGRGGRGRGGGGGGFNRGRGREYERHSGSTATGVKPVEKRDGAGAHNWGTVKDDIDEQLKTDGEPTAAKDQDWAEAVEQENAAEAGAEQQNEKMMTLEEWKRQQAEDRAKLQGDKSGDQSRKVDTSSFKEMTAYRKERINEDDDSDAEDELSTVQMMAKKSDIETNFFYNNPQANYDDRRRGGRGGRGGRGRGGDNPRGAPRGGRGRGGPGPSGPSGAKAEFRVDDKDFPDLH